jgi:hypothetical protein
MRIKDPHQAYVDQGKQFDSYEAFFESLYECQTCGSLFDDESDMSEICIDTCLDCVVTAAAPPPRQGYGPSSGAIAAEIKKHLKQGEQ